MTDPRTIDPDLLGRWVAIASLLASARELEGRGGGAWRPLGLVAADTAIEAILGTIATSLGEAPGRDATFEQTFQLADGALAGGPHAIDQSLRTRIHTIHRQRNAAVHHGDEPGGQAVSRAIATALELRELAVNALTLLEAFRDAGPARAVGRIVAIEPISTSLGEAERLLGLGQLLAAADQCAIALDAALERVKPDIRSYKRVPIDTPRDVVKAIAGVSEQTVLHEAWILALGIGIRPVELERLQRVVGEPIFTAPNGPPTEVIHSERVTLTEALVTWALRTTTDVVFRLWQGEALASRPWPYDDEDVD
jgi:hypothetical protein